MPVNMRLFGTLSDGRAVHAARLERPDGLALEVLDYGAAVRSLSAPAAGRRLETVLGFDTARAYEADRSYQGCVVGRFANRIAGAGFEIDGERFTLTANEGPNTLHGGAFGLSKRLWRFRPSHAGEEAIVLDYSSPDGEEGFPGRLELTVAFVLEAADTLAIRWEARTDRPTPVNLTHHLYFNLAGDFLRPTLDHTLQIAADAFTPVRPDLIPTGRLAPVAATPFDLRRPARLGDIVGASDPQLTMGGGIDHNWALRPDAAPALRLRSPESGLALSVVTDQPGVQVYSGQGLGGGFARYGGIAIEPQNFPDAVNQAGFPDPVLRPGEVYRRWARYRFEAGAPG